MSLADIDAQIKSVITMDGIDYSCDGLTAPKKSAGGESYTWGIKPLTSQPTVAASGSGSELLAGTYKIHAVTYSSKFGINSQPYDVDAPMEITITDGQDIDISAIPLTTENQSDQVHFYRTLVNQEAPFYYCGYQFNGTATQTLNGGDSSLDKTNRLLPNIVDDLNFAGPFVYDIAPVKKRCISWDNRAWMYGERVYQQGDVTCTDDSDIVTGDGVEWTGGLNGKKFWVYGDTAVYEIAEVLTADTLRLTTNYQTEPSRATDPTNVKYFITGEGRELLYSYQGNPDYWPFDNQMLLAQDGSESLIGAEVINDKLYLFTEARIYEIFRTLDDNSPYGSRETSSVVGAGSARSLVSVGNVIYFYSGTNFYAFDGNSSYPMGDDVEPMLDTYPAENLEFIVGCKVDDSIFWAVNSNYSVDNYDQILKYNYQQKFWDSVWTGVDVVDINGVVLSDGSEELHACWDSAVGYYLITFSPWCKNDGAGSGKYTGIVTSATINTLTDTTAAFQLDDNLHGVLVYIASGTGAGQRRTITSNTTDTLTLNVDWDTIPDATSVYGIGSILWDAWSNSLVIDPDVEKVLNFISLSCEPQAIVPVANELMQIGWRLDEMAGWSYFPAGLTLDAIHEQVPVNLKALSFQWRLKGWTPNERIRVRYIGTQAQLGSTPLSPIMSQR